MKQTINFHDFCEAFADYDRQETFSMEGLKILFNYLEELEENTCMEIELDVIALYCDYAEDTPEDIANNYGIDISECADDEETMETVKEYLENATFLVGETGIGTLVYQPW